MPIDIISSAFFDGPEVIPGWHYLKRYAPLAAAVGAVKYYTNGASNTWSGDLHGKVFIVTGGTSGLGAAVTYQLALKGAQVVLLCRQIDDVFTIDFVEDMRNRTNNFMVYAEQCDFLLLHSVRLFATRWLDNQPPRRLDGVICCAAEALPKWKPRQVSEDGVELQIAVNYLGPVHLLTLLKPLLHVQPADRDVRVVVATCLSQAFGEVNEKDLLWDARRYPSSNPLAVYGTSKLLLGMFGRQFQRLLNAYERTDKAPCNIRVSVVNPGIMRTASTRRYISMGTLWGLFLYLVMYPVWWLFLKGLTQGAQLVMFAVLAPILGAQDGGNLVQECKILAQGRKEYYDYDLQERVAEKTQELIKALEMLSAVERKKRDPSGKTSTEKKEGEKLTDLSLKPESEEDLDYKLQMMRKSMGLPMGAGNLFSENEAVKSENSSANPRKAKAKQRKSNRK